LIRDMLSQAKAPFTDDDFRQAAAYGLCVDYDRYSPAEELRPILAHWQMFQLREYYVYALYALWVYFLHWLRREGPQTFEGFCAHLNEAIDLSTSGAAVGLTISQGRHFADRSSISTNEHVLYQLLDRTRPTDSAVYFGTTWLLLSTLFLRLSGLRRLERSDAWYWARFGGARRRAVALFVRDAFGHMAAGDSILDAWTWLYRDYVIAQHIITALEKWGQRRANTFHFNYDRGIFEWVRDGGTGFSASRFRQAYNMLSDLGLFEVTGEEGNPPKLTDLGQQSLQRVLEACSG
jgi:hypothetical protein